ncbi:MAG TPA: glycoside hydrolase family 28 protein [Candidatus Paceibacterota bacterium]|nr:glycoside hydrolase family 28 protein [Candidatus Paceibacterota bacterium]
MMTFHPRHLFRLLLMPSAASVALCTGALASADDALPAVEGWAQVPAILERIVPPKFPAQEFSIADHGAVGDGKADCTEAFKKAIQLCSSKGGGRVVVPAGKFFTGPIHLNSNVELHLADGAEIIFSDRFEDYLPPVFVRAGGVELYNYSPLIYAKDCTNIAVTGKGRLNGNAKRWWNWKTNETKEFFDMGARGTPVEQRVFGTPKAGIRPSFLSFVSCTNVLLEGFTIGSGPNWTIHPIYCQNTTIRRVNVDTDGPNNDGIDPDSCRDMLIEDCTFSTGDDCVVLKSGYNEDGWRVNRPTENVIMRRCFSKRGHGGLVVGSEMSGSVRNVFMSDCKFDGTDRAVRIKARRGRGGVVENIWARNLQVKNMQREVVILNMDYSSDKKQAANEKPPVFRNMVISDVTGDGAPTAILISGLADSPVENIRFENMTIRSTKGVVASSVKGLVFTNVNITATGLVFNLTDAAQITIQKSKAAPETDTFLKLAGINSSNVLIEASDLSAARKIFTTGEGVSTNAVTVK